MSLLPVGSSSASTAGLLWKITTSSRSVPPFHVAKVPPIGYSLLSTSADTTTASSCPVGIGSSLPSSFSSPSKDKSSTTTGNHTNKPFSDIPGPYAYPFVGTLPDFWMKRSSNLQRAHLDYYVTYGPIVKHSILGDTEILIYHPQDYHQVFRAEGKYPFSTGQEFWPFATYFDSRQMDMPLARGGNDWKTRRTQLQKDIFSPQAADQYASYVYPVAKEASSLFGNYSNNSMRNMKKQKDGDEEYNKNNNGGLKSFTTRYSFDAFCAAILGRSLGTVNKETCRPEDEQFIAHSIRAFECMAALAFSPAEKIQKVQWNRTTPMWKEFESMMDAVHQRGEEIVMEIAKGTDVGSNRTVVKTKKDVAKEEDVDFESLWNGTHPHSQLSKEENEVGAGGSYLERLIRRGEITPNQAATQVASLLFAGVDTTSTFLQWFLINLARNPSVQERLREEISQINLDDIAVKGKLHLPYLKACYRESHRLTPVGTMLTYRRLTDDITLQGYHIPAGTKLTFNIEAIQKDPTYVKDNVNEFIPERWLHESVQSRSGTPQEVLDHKLLATPFSFGPRMCLGGRLAEVELFAIVAVLVRDWKFTLADPDVVIGNVQHLMLQPDPMPELVVQPVVSN